MSRCIVIGGGGFIGGRVVEALLKSGREVVVLGRTPNAASTAPMEADYRTGDYGDRETLRSLLKPGCTVINLAYSTVPKTSYEDPLHDLLSNLPANVSLLEECVSANIAKLVMVSSGGTVYGPVEKLPIREQVSAKPVSPYGISKLSSDLYTLMFHRNARLPAVVVRPANAYGEIQSSGKGQGFIAEAVDAVLRGREIQIYGERGTIRDYIHVEDVASGIIAALDHGESGGVYNIGTGIGTSNLDVISMLNELAAPFDIRVNSRKLPPRVFDVAANILDSTSLKEISGWNPLVSISDGIRRVWESRMQSRVN
jgi:UDP-glucose 4-epimerase